MKLLQELDPKSVLLTSLLAILASFAFLLYYFQNKSPLNGGVAPPQQPLTTSAFDFKSLVRERAKRYGTGPFTLSQVKQHNTKDDCWVIIDGKVYDVTPFVEEHPGGDAIYQNAGGDASIGFHGPQHPASVWDMIDLFFIGEVDKSS
eukprot:gene10647-14299_t